MSYHFDCESFRLPLTIFISEAITKKPNNAKLHKESTDFFLYRN